jgi:hypothetical protein
MRSALLGTEKKINHEKIDIKTQAMRGKINFKRDIDLDCLYALTKPSLLPKEEKNKSNLFFIP